MLLLAPLVDFPELRKIKQSFFLYIITKVIKVMLFFWVFVSEKLLLLLCILQECLTFSLWQVLNYIVEVWYLFGYLFTYTHLTFNSPGISLKKRALGDGCAQLQGMLLWSQTEPKETQGFKRTSKWQGLTEIKEGWLAS